jgi:hypothetical protein
MGLVPLPIGWYICNRHPLVESRIAWNRDRTANFT